MRSIKWCQFQWSWTNPNPVIKVTPLFDAKYLTNGYRYGHSYYRRRIYESVPKLSNGTNFNDLEWSLTPISRSRYYSTSNNSRTVQDRASYNGGLIESYTWSIESRHFQWPWTTTNPDFKVRPFFDAEYLLNGCRYSHSYYGRRTGNRTEAFKRYHFQWPWVTSNPHFKVTIIFNVKYLV